MKTLPEIQREVGAWSREQFGYNHSRDESSLSHGYPLNDLCPLLGIVEEVGELAHAVLYRHQGRGYHGAGGAEEHRADREDALADILVYLCDYACRGGIDLTEVLDRTWAKVSCRRRPTWQADKEAEREGATPGLQSWRAAVHGHTPDTALKCPRCEGRGLVDDFPMAEDGAYAPCPLCGRRTCDHTPGQRGDVPSRCPDCKGAGRKSRPEGEHLPTPTPPASEKSSLRALESGELGARFLGCRYEYPCCEAVRRVEAVPGDATTLLGGICQVHGVSYVCHVTTAPAPVVEMKPSPDAHPSHEWEKPDKAQTKCEICGAHRHLSSGTRECPGENDCRKKIRDKAAQALHVAKVLNMADGLFIDTGAAPFQGLDGRIDYARKLKCDVDNKWFPGDVRGRASYVAGDYDGLATAVRLLLASYRRLRTVVEAHGLEGEVLGEGTT